ncbi:type I restriction-modification system endonuclease [Burkholderia sp. MSMB1498]|uniref:type I restriction-modification system endonuclease n=1 Tax=Burkholderia sp. MSMB1498 TaxID=1637842 RepID=UPI0007550FCE|nr:type I restriction-modification system endonuclease [Burkholderia sp. MSMB1498]KVK77176.1 hypothetical protein WS91_01905 [Burkholderia sp. MSMB1498]
MDRTEKSKNFWFLEAHDPLFLQLCVTAERYCVDDPNTAVIKLRQFGEAVVKHLAADFGVASTGADSQAELLKALQVQRLLDRNVAELLHFLRREGNIAAHEFHTTVGRAKRALGVARELAIWLHRSSGKADPHSFKPGPFVAPESTLEALHDQLSVTAERARAAQQLIETERGKRASAEAQAATALTEKAIWEQLAQDEERERLRLSEEFEKALAQLRAEAAQRAPEEARAMELRLARASVAIALDEAETRAIIDSQLNDAGWEADTENLTYGKGARPEAGKYKAIAEWPTAKGPADYVLFHGLTPLAIVEAKRYGSDVPVVIEQAERYNEAYQVKADEVLPAAANHVDHFPGWPAEVSSDGTVRYYRLPFVYATNGRPFLRQLQTKSGIWFRDVRESTAHARALTGWHSPEGLQKLFENDIGAATGKLTQEPYDYLNLRDYQVRAVRKIEEALAAGRRECLVAMATGTGKTRTIIGLIYRIIKSRRFNRVLFLVDRNALGEQAQNTFKDMRLEQNQVFTDIYDVKELADIKPDSATKVHVATVQGMVRRLFGATDDPIPIDRYDCIVVDEAHRGYILDREMGEGELEFRSEADYISSYRRVLDHFDAVKIGLTATPAQHTCEIFGAPIYTYSYSEAVIDGWLVDHEPPVRFVTKLAESGIHFDKGDAVKIVRNTTGTLDTTVLPDELDFEIDAFNRLVITENFNRVVCAELAKQIDPSGDQKTLIFCANDAHANLVVTLLKDALEICWGALDDKTVRKITARADRPDDLIRRYRNERLPNIAVTVDLLTTGIDVPQISNLVFLRRVRSRILYEQMLGRATRLCPEIGKDVFRIFDAVEIYSALEPVNTMKPVVQRVTVSLAQLLAELASDKSHTLPGPDLGRSYADEVKDQLVVRLRRLMMRAEVEAKSRPEIGQAIEAVEAATGVSAIELPEHLRKLSATEAQGFIRSLPQLASLLQSLQLGSGAGSAQIISEHDDELVAVETGYGKAKRPEDYLDAFRLFIEENRNRIVALNVVLTRPRDLTREDLRQLRLALAEAEFSEAALRTAWRETKNEDIAASVIGYIRQMALGSPLLPFEARVDRALKKTLASRTWPLPQRKWLERIAKEVKHSIIVDDTTFESGAFKSAGGLKTLQHVFQGQVHEVVAELEDAVWDDAA